MRLLIASITMLITSAAIVSGAEPSHSDYGLFREYLVGRWKVESPSFSGTTTFTMSPTKRSLTSYREMDNGSSYHAIEGYDPEKKCWKRVIFWGHGDHSIATTKIEETSSNGSIKGFSLKGEVHDIRADGGSTETPVVYKVIDENRWEITRQGITILHTRAATE